MATHLGRGSRRLAAVAALKTVKGRREQGRFSFEGATLLDEALLGGMAIDEVYVTATVFAATKLVRDLDAAGTRTFLVDDRTAARLSDVETPSGLVAVAPMRFRPLPEMLERDGVVLVLGDLNDPGNAGTLVRSADAFGALGVLFGRTGVDPYHPKVVRAAMGAVFRMDLALGGPAELRAAATAGRFSVIGLTAGGSPVDALSWPTRAALVVGHERHGLGAWLRACERQVGIRMREPSESLNAGIAGSIALYEFARSRP